MATPHLEVPALVLIISYWLHLIATVVWIGGLVFMAWFVIPGVQRALPDDPAQARLLDSIQRRFNPWANLSIAMLLTTGLVQMSANKNYNGFLQIDNPWTQAILLKHLAVAGMVGLAGYMSWVVLPGLARLAMLAAARPGRGAETQSAALRRRQAALVRINLALSVVVLVLTAIARTQ